MAETSLGNLPGQDQDPAAREIRRRLEASAEEPRALVRPDAIDVIGQKNEALLTSEMYAVSSFVIEQFWEYLKGVPKTDLMDLAPASGSVYERFATACAAFQTMHWKGFYDDAMQRLKTPGYVLTKSDALYLRYLQLAGARFGKTGSPSMTDISSLTARMAEVAPRVFQRDRGRLPTEEEHLALLRHPSLLRFYGQLMTNSREALFPLFMKLEGSEDFNLDDYSRTFQEEYFEIREEEDGTLALRLKEEVAQAYVQRLTELAKEMKDAGDTPPQALQCPVLYTKITKEIMDWVLDEFAAFKAKAEA